MKPSNRFGITYKFHYSSSMPKSSTSVLNLKFKEVLSGVSEISPETSLYDNVIITNTSSKLESELNEINTLNACLASGKDHLKKLIKDEESKKNFITEKAIVLLNKSRETLKKWIRKRDLNQSLPDDGIIKKLDIILY